MVTSQSINFLAEKVVNPCVHMAASLDPDDDMADVDDLFLVPEVLNVTAAENTATMTMSYAADMVTSAVSSVFSSFWPSSS